MKVSFNWLRELVELKPGVTADSVAQQLTLVGLEVESIERRGRDVAGVVIAEVRGTRPHPGSDKLTLVRVVAGGAQPDEEEVVCGARNVPGPGGKVAWAPPGATLPGGRKLERKDVRGVSSPGMLCSEVELGISEAGDGILILSPDAPVGADLAGHVGLLDEVLEVNVTPNRPDALSHVGIAREVAALFAAPWKLPPPDAASEIPLPAGRGVDVQIRDAAGCPRYNARIITGLAVGPSPLAMRVRLAACGMRAISNLVDVTNYVMLETGHPLHAFDLDKLRGGIQIRRANRGERMTTLDGVDRPLQESDVVIADDGGAIALAGVMGGADSEISASTTARPAGDGDVRSARHPAHGEAAGAAQRGVASLRARRRRRRHPARQPPGRDACSRARAAAPWRARASTATRSRRRRGACRCRSRGSRAWRGSRSRSRRRRRSWRRSASPARPTAPTRLTATIPSFRPDISIEQDLVEEVMRMVGYDRAPARLPRSSGAPAPSPQALRRSRARSAGRAGAGRDRQLGLRPARLAGAAGRAALGGRGRQEPDLGRLRGDADVAAAGAAGRGPPQRRARRRRTSACSRSGPSSGAAPTPRTRRREPSYAAGDPGRPARRLVEAGRRRRFLRRQARRHRAACAASGSRRRASCRVRAALLHPGAGAAIHVDGGDAPIGQVGEVHPRIARALGPGTAGRLRRGDARRRRGTPAADPTACRRRASRRSRATSRSGSTWRSPPTSSARC